MRNKKNQWVKYVRVIGFIISIGLFIIALKSNFIETQEKLIPLTRATLIFAISMLFTDGLSRIIYEIRNNDQYLDFKNTLESQINCNLLTNTEEAIKYVTSKLDQIQSIDNTHIKLGGTSLNSGIYNSNIYNQYVKTLRKEIKNGLVFRDVIGKSSVEYRNKQLITWVKNNSPKGGLFIKIIKSDIPVINHFILTYKDGKKEVLFGWAYKKDNPIEQVFLSKDKDLISYFSKYFENLYNIGAEMENL